MLGPTVTDGHARSSAFVLRRFVAEISDGETLTDNVVEERKGRRRTQATIRTGESLFEGRGMRVQKDPVKPHMGTHPVSCEPSNSESDEKIKF